ncbi:hypothetical protein IFR04_011912 [Cadophora malorum]|uniref:Uncharacterized protein n=1 Tax=Cadophora malorum TaxID=108018 RepID=A0A8H7T9H1_9HELO|nr:hypothetical protein IFR04_011912 [Cadophora malorum]
MGRLTAQRGDGEANNSVHMPTPLETLVSPSMPEHQQFHQAEDQDMTQVTRWAIKSGQEVWTILITSYLVMLHFKIT